MSADASHVCSQYHHHHHHHHEQKDLFFYFLNNFPTTPMTFFNTPSPSSLHLLASLWPSEYVCAQRKVPQCFASASESLWWAMKHETKNIKQQKKSILLSFVFFLPFLVFSQQGRRPDISNYLSFLSVSRSDGGMLLDHKVVVAHIFLLCCWTWNEEKMDKAEISFSPGGCYFSWRLMWSVMIEVKWELMMEGNEITPKFWNKVWIMNSQEWGQCTLLSLPQNSLSWFCVI